MLPRFREFVPSNVAFSHPVSRFLTKDISFLSSYHSNLMYTLTYRACKKSRFTYISERTFVAFVLLGPS